MITTEKNVVSKGKAVIADNATVDNLLRNYKQNRWAENSKRLGKPDSLSVWQSIEDLEKFIEIAKEHGADGIKMYFGAHSEENAENPKYNGLQTIVMVATRTAKGKEGSMNKDINFRNGKGHLSVLGNGGPLSLCPPTCPVAESGDNTFGKLGATLIDNGPDGITLI